MNLHVLKKKLEKDHRENHLNFFSLRSLYGLFNDSTSQLQRTVRLYGYAAVRIFVVVLLVSF